MGVDHPERRGLFAQIADDARQRGVLDRVGEIARMKSVPVIHAVR